MARELIVQELSDTGPLEVARLRAPRIPVGRESPGGFELPVEGISRSHGLFIQAKDHWLYSDQGSTNGSWVNDERIYAGTWRLVRAGDSLQMANVMLRLVDARGSTAPARQSLLVLKNGQVSDEFPVPESGQALVIGGSRGDLTFDDEASQEPAALIEKRDGALTLSQKTATGKIKLNGGPAAVLSELRDNDQVEVDKYTIIVNSPQERRTPVQRAPGQGDPAASRLTSKKLVFGRSEDQADTDVSVDSTQTIDPSVLAELRKSYGKKLLESDNPVEAAQKYALLEDSIIMIVGIGLLGALIGVVIWWFFRK